MIKMLVYRGGFVRPLVTVEFEEYEQAMIAAENTLQIGVWVDSTLYAPWGLDRVELVEGDEGYSIEFDDDLDISV